MSDIKLIKILNMKKNIVTKVLTNLVTRTSVHKIDLSENSNENVFHVILIKPTRYDDEGYPIQWYRSSLPSNSLACLYGIARDCAERQILGKDVEIRIFAVDEANEALDYPRLIRSVTGAGQTALVCLVGVQTNQFPRAVDIAQPFLAAGFPVCMGGFHVTGCISMLEELPAELVEAQGMGISLFAGEAESHRLDRVIHDAWENKLNPLYNFQVELVELSGQPIPFMPGELVERNLTTTTTIDLGRGCPFTCSFCCIINVQGRKSRARSVDDMEQLIRRVHNFEQTSVFITDDNFARNRDWEAYFDRIIELRKEGIKLRFIIQVDTLCHRIPGFIDKAVEAGVTQVFIGLENINPDNLAAMDKKQNRITEYRDMLLEWKRHPVVIWGAYIIGLPNDTRESILRDVDIIKRELPIDLFNPSILTPLPGSRDHVEMLKRGEWMDPDFNKYDLAHRVIHHSKMSDEELDSVYIEAWDRYYTFDHMVTILKRMFALGSDKKLLTVERLIAFGVITRLYNIRSYDMGLVRRHSRLSRRKGYRKESFIVFHARKIYYTVKNISLIIYHFNKLHRAMTGILNDPDKRKYVDIAIKKQGKDELNQLDLYQSTRGGKEVVEKHIKKLQFHRT